MTEMIKYKLVFRREVEDHYEIDVPKEFFEKRKKEKNLTDVETAQQIIEDGWGGRKFTNRLKSELISAKEL